MDIIKKTRQDLKDYVKSLNTPDNKIYQENELLILSCFAKAQEILEKNEEKALLITDVSQQRELLDAFCCTMEFDIKHETYEEDIEYFLEQNSSI